MFVATFNLSFTYLIQIMLLLLSINKYETFHDVEHGCIANCGQTAAASNLLTAYNL